MHVGRYFPDTNLNTIETESDWGSDDNEPWDDSNVCIDDNVALVHEWRENFPRNYYFSKKQFDFLKLLIFHIQIPNGSRTENLELQNNNESTDGDLEYLNFDDDWKNAVEEALI
ncbi:14348_t:CDS:2 [Entrophospora sp. SA101]|nr:14348_t:CDS:2 [Entrophospora sp. SA101]